MSRKELETIYQQFTIYEQTWIRLFENKYTTAHQERVSIFDMSDQILDQIPKVQKNRKDEIEETMKAEIRSDKEYIECIESIVKNKEGRLWRITATMLGILLLLVIILEVAYNQQFRQWLSDHFPWVALITIAAIIAALIAWNRSRKP